MKLPWLSGLHDRCLAIVSFSDELVKKFIYKMTMHDVTSGN